VADYILNGGDKAAFLEKFKNAMSKGFDPDKHLKKVTRKGRSAGADLSSNVCEVLYAAPSHLVPIGAAQGVVGFDVVGVVCDSISGRCMQHPVMAGWC
jgi:hypothetical protein